MLNAFAVRAVIIGENNQIPILKIGGGEYYKIPGGTVEDGENETEALAREIKEDAGCEARVIREIGKFEFYVKEKDKTYHSTCYLAKLTKHMGGPQFDHWEQERGFKLLWVSIDEAVRIFEKCRPTDPYERIVHNRDLNFIKEAKELIEEKKF